MSARVLDLETSPASRFAWERVLRRVQLGPDDVAAYLPDGARRTAHSAVKSVALMLATYGNADGSSLYPGVDKLARTSGRGKKTVIEALAVLRAVGLIERVAVGNPRRGTSDQYRLSLPVDVTSRLPMLDPTEDHIDTSPGVASTPATGVVSTLTDPSVSVASSTHQVSPRPHQVSPRPSPGVEATHHQYMTTEVDQPKDQEDHRPAEATDRRTDPIRSEIDEALGTVPRCPHKHRFSNDDAAPCPTCAEGRSAETRARKAAT